MQMLEAGGGSGGWVGADNCVSGGGGGVRKDRNEEKGAECQACAEEHQTGPPPNLSAEGVDGCRR